MKSIFIYLTASLSLLLSCSKLDNLPIKETPDNPSSKDTTILKVDFNKYKNGESYGKAKAKSDFGGCDYFDHPNYATIKNKALRVKYPAHLWTKGGVISQIPIPKNNTYTLSYKIYFENGFEWKKGGKLPGLAGGTAPTGGVNGANIAKSGTGFSARFMWHPNGELIAYLYHKDMKGIYGTNIKATYQGENYRFPTNQWVTITQYVKVNTQNNSNGVLKVWITDANKKKLVIEKNNITWMTKNNNVDKFLLSTFFGGGDVSWAPSKDCYIKFDDFEFSYKK